MPLDLDKIRNAINGPMRIPIGAKDRKGVPIHIGDTVRFADAHEWGGGDVPEWVTRLERGRLYQGGGATGDLSSFCEVVASDGIDPVATIRALLAEVDRLNAELSTIKRDSVVKWADTLDGFKAEKGDFTFTVGPDGWWLSILDRRGVDAWIEGGNETGDAGKAACTAAYLRTVGQ